MFYKNRNRDIPDFANINLLGNCNANCYFCLGKDISSLLEGKNQLNIHFSKWINFDKFLKQCKESNIKKLYLTGQTADGLQYKYLNEIVDYLQNDNFIAGVRTNGLLVLKNRHIIKKMLGGIGISIHSLDDETNLKIMDIPTLNWDVIIPECGENVRASIVLNRYNSHEIFDLIKYISKFKNVRYIQIRRVSSDTRVEYLREDIELYENFLKSIRNKFELKNKFYDAEIYNIFNMDVCFWATVETTANSFNYFTDGTISKEYFIVEGYSKNYKEG